MILRATTTPQKFPRIFKRPTWILVQVNNTTAGAILHLGTDQGEVANVGPFSDGYKLSGDVASPFFDNPFLMPMPWYGELWYSAEVAASPTGDFPFIVLVLGEYGLPNKPDYDDFTRAQKGAPRG